MSDFHDMDSIWEMSAKRKRKEKKKPKKNKRTAMEMDEQVKRSKKKKGSKFKEVMKGKRGKVKDKKKKKKRAASKVDESVKGAQSSNGEATRLLLLQDEELIKEQQKVRRKKKVAFDLKPGIKRAKRPHLSSPPQSLLLEEGGRCSQVTATEQSNTQTHYNDSECTSDDINSQDLFITQKTFRAPPSLPSSDEAIDKAILAIPAEAQMEERHDDSFKDSHFHQHHRESTERVQKRETEWVLFTEEDSRVKKELKQEKEELCPVFIKNPFQDDLNVTSQFLEVTKVKPSPSHIQPLGVSWTNTSTQTENFFTAELSSFLKFGQKVREAVHAEDLQPLDLSLPLRARRDLRKTFCVSEDIKSDDHKNLNPFCLSDVKEKLSEPTGLCSVSMRGNRERNVSSQSESDNKSADTTISSEDSEAAFRVSKLDLVQVRAVQMRLNESFFFKTKGEGGSPRPESPLMKLSQGHKEVKSKKGR